MKAQHSLFATVLCLSVFVFSGPATGRGAISWILDRVGLGQLGDNLDTVHGIIKRTIPVYGTVEEQVTDQVRRRAQFICASFFGVVTKPIIVACETDPEASENLELIE